MLKKTAAIFLLICFLPLFAFAEAVKQPAVINLVETPDAEWQFQEGANILEVLFPQMFGADACILRHQGRVMLVDAGTPGQHDAVAEALGYLGITHVDTGFNTHPHDDHIGGFEVLHQAATLGELYITFPEDANNNMRRAMKAMQEQGVPVLHAGDGDLIPFGDVRLEVIQRNIGWMTENDCSAMIRLDYGERSLMLTADVDIDGQTDLIKTIPDKLAVDIFKYPHHGVRPAGWTFLELLSAELSVVTNSRQKTQESIRSARYHDFTTLHTPDGMVRLRTDGKIWVVDQIKPDAE